MARSQASTYESAAMNPTCRVKPETQLAQTVRHWVACCLIAVTSTAGATTSAAAPAAVQAASQALASAARVPESVPGERLVLDVLAPTAKLRQTSRTHAHIVGRTHPEHAAFIGGEPVNVASTGLFVRDQVALVDGVNRIELRVLARDGTSRTSVLEITRINPDAAGEVVPPKTEPWVSWPAAKAFAVGAAGADLTWGLHHIRLGGPNLAELPHGTRVMADGQQGDFVRIRLTSEFTAWTAARNLEPLTETTPPRPFTLNNLSLVGEAAGDTLSIPWQPKVPFAVRQQRGPHGKPVIELEFFGGHLAATWLTHHNPQTVEVVNVEQTQAERPVVRLSLNDKTLWGYTVRPSDQHLRVLVRPAPVLSSTADAPLGGLHVVLEAGHGGPTNLGAVGLTGAREKDVNLATTWLLKVELERAGARVSMVREGEENPSPSERARLAAATAAHLFVSVHANATETDRGFLRGKGASVFYKHEHGRLLAAAIHKRFLAASGLPDFGLVGNFNYTPIRLNTAMPSVLVELAFMSNPYEEAQLLQPAARERMARAIRDGIQDFVCTSTGQACTAR